MGSVLGPVQVPTESELDQLFKYHALTDEGRARCGYIMDAARKFAEAITTWCPPTPDMLAALRKVREASMTANAAIANKIDYWRTDG